MNAPVFKQKQFLLLLLLNSAVLMALFLLTLFVDRQTFVF